MIKKIIFYVSGVLLTAFIGLLFIPITKNIEKDNMANEEKLHNFLEPFQTLLNNSKQDFMLFMNSWNRLNNNNSYWQTFKVYSTKDLNLVGKYIVTISQQNNNCIINIQNRITLLENSSTTNSSAIFCNGQEQEKEIFISKIGQGEYSFRFTRPTDEELAWMKFIRLQKENYYGKIKEILNNNSKYYFNDPLLKEQISYLNIHINGYLKVIEQWDNGNYSEMSSKNNFPKDLEKIIQNEIEQLSKENEAQHNLLYKIIRILHF